MSTWGQDVKRPTYSATFEVALFSYDEPRRDALVPPVVKRLGNQQPTEQEKDGGLGEFIPPTFRLPLRTS